jgi:outer membrane protein assembly factor BamC
MCKLKSLVALPIVLLVAACSSLPDMSDYLPDQSLDYKRQREATEDLAVPPNLLAGKFDDAMDVPGLGGTATYSQYVGERQKRHEMATSGEVLPEFKDVTLKEQGDNRWLLVKATPQQVWPRVVSFWRSQGILLVEQDPTVGVMKTDWIENRAEIRKDFITNVLRKVVGGLYETSTRDQYRVRIEPGMERGTTDIYLTQRGMVEKLLDNGLSGTESTVWEPGPSDPGKEAIMLRRLMVYLGVSEKQAAQSIAQSETTPETTGMARLTQGSGGQPELVIDQDFPQAWRLTGLALDRVGFAVQDQDRTQGIYYVRYESGFTPKKKRGFFSRLAFWRSNEVEAVSQYRVKLNSDGKQTRVVVLNQVGQPANPASAQRILKLLEEEIR